MYIDGFSVAVPHKNKAAYLEHATKMAVQLKALGAKRVVEGWGNDVPEGENTSFSLAVKREEGEVVCFSWIEWENKQIHDEAWEKLMSDPLMQNDDWKKIFDGKRMIFGGFDMILDV
jgi:uncharacterized protein YbaA (DUF1428 family)